MRFDVIGVGLQRARQMRLPAVAISPDRNAALPRLESGLRELRVDLHACVGRRARARGLNSSRSAGDRRFRARLRERGNRAKIGRILQVVTRLMKSAEIRTRFLKFFEERGHTVVASSPLVPANDPTLLFTNSGMVQFKDVFLGRETRPYRRADAPRSAACALAASTTTWRTSATPRATTRSSRCSATSPSATTSSATRSASPGSCSPRCYKLPPEKLWTTVYHEDNEAYDLWTKEIGVPKERCIRIGDKPGGPKYQSDNFWQMADTGPCGPCSEIFYDHGPARRRRSAGIERGRRRPLHRDLEPRLHAVQPRREGRR